MVKKQFRGLASGGIKSRIKTKHREPKASHDWVTTRKFNKKRFHLDTIKVKKPTKKEISDLRKKKNVRVVSEKPRFGYRVNVQTGAVVGKYGIYTSPKKAQPKKSGRKRKPGKRKVKKSRKKK